jgi:hypothetical protein
MGKELSKKLLRAGVCKEERVYRNSEVSRREAARVGYGLAMFYKQTPSLHTSG